MKWIKRTLQLVLGLVVIAAAVVYLWSSMIINRDYAAEPRSILLSSRPDVIEHGERMAQVFGCFHGCHGADMEGTVFFEAWYAGRIIAPNLTRAMRAYSHSELEAMIRQGVRPGGTSLFGMPSASFASMTDRDLSAILSFMDGYPEQDLDLGRSSYGGLARLLMIQGEFKAEAGMVKGRPWDGGMEQDRLRHGEYLAMNACSECHGLDLEGGPGFAPPLVTAKSYALEDFRTLLSTGVGAGGRDLGLMSKVAEFRFSRLSDTEVEALYEFLHSR